MHSWRGFGVLELLLVLVLAGSLSALLLGFAQHAQKSALTTPASWSSATSRAQLQLLRLQAQQLQLLHYQQQEE
jgi:Tfp pilus assembly protein FimT